MLWKNEQESAAKGIAMRKMPTTVLERTSMQKGSEADGFGAARSAQNGLFRASRTLSEGKEYEEMSGSAVGSAVEKYDFLLYIRGNCGQSGR
jgi:hypothetical protein